MPILTLQTRLKEVGRIRIGQKGPKGQPQKLSCFRFTSFDKRAIDKIAQLYGGEVRPCTDKDLQGQHEVITNASELPFIVSPVPPSQYMELWSGGGCQRRCDGQTEHISGKNCVCTPGEEECKPTTRLSLVLPDVPGIGVWRLESKGWNAAVELISTFEFLQKISGPGRPATGLLALEERTGRVDGKTTRFMVPVIRTEFTPGQLLAASAQSLNPGDLSLPAPQATQPATVNELPAPNADPAHVVKDPNPRGAFFAIAHEMGLPPHDGDAKEMYYDVVGKVVGRELTSLAMLTDDEWQTCAAWLRKVQSGENKTPKRISDYLTANALSGEYDPFADVPQDEVPA